MGRNEKSQPPQRSKRNFIVAGFLAVAAAITGFILGRDYLSPAPQQPPPSRPEAMPPVAAPPKVEVPKRFSGDQIVAETIKYPGEAGEISAYQARPKFDAAFPAVIIIHENAGLLPHFKDVSRRFAMEGYVAIAVDFLSRVGGTGQDENDNRVKQAKLKDAEVQSEVDSTVKYLKSQPFVKGNKIGVGPGFCWGGRQALIAALRSREFAAGVTYYGFPVLARTTETQTFNPIELAPASATPIIAHFGEADRAIPLDQVDRFRQVLENSKKDFELYIYPAAGHAFFNDSRPQVYNEEAAKLSWERTLVFLGKKLKA